MPRQKEPPKPIVEVKGDFYRSLDQLAQECNNMISFLETMLQMTEKDGAAYAKLKPMLTERLALLREAYSGAET